MTATRAISVAPADLSLVPVWTYDAIDGQLRPAARARAWTREQVVAAMREWNAVKGRPPRSYEWAPSTGRAAGLLPSGPALWELEFPRWPSTSTVAARFGSWCNGLRAAELPARIPEHQLPRAERIRAARRLVAAGSSTAATAQALGVSTSTVTAYLRGGDCPACGGPLVCGTVCSNCTPRKAPAASRADVVAALRAWATEHGRAPYQHEWGWRAGPGSPWVREFPRWPGASTVRTHFGTWNAALEHAGVGLRRRSDWSDADLLAAMRRWAEQHDGRPPRSADFKHASDRTAWPDPKTVASRFGGWRIAIAAAGLDGGMSQRTPAS